MKETKADKNVGVRYMKSSWEWEREFREEEREEARKEFHEEIEAERKRADEAEKDKRMLEAELAKYKSKYGVID